MLGGLFSYPYDGFFGESDRLINEAALKAYEQALLPTRAQIAQDLDRVSTLTDGLQCHEAAIHIAGYMPYLEGQTRESVSTELTKRRDAHSARKPK